MNFSQIGKRWHSQKNKSKKTCSSRRRSRRRSSSSSRVSRPKPQAPAAPVAKQTIMDDLDKFLKPKQAAKINPVVAVPTDGGKAGAAVSAVNQSSDKIVSIVNDNRMTVNQGGDFRQNMLEYLQKVAQGIRQEQKAMSMKDLKKCSMQTPQHILALNTMETMLKMQRQIISENVQDVLSMAQPIDKLTQISQIESARDSTLGIIDEFINMVNKNKLQQMQCIAQLFQNVTYQGAGALKKFDGAVHSLPGDKKDVKQMISGNPSGGTLQLTPMGEVVNRLANETRAAIEPMLDDPASAAQASNVLLITDKAENVQASVDTAVQPMIVAGENAAAANPLISKRIADILKKKVVEVRKKLVEAEEAAMTAQDDEGGGGSMMAAQARQAAEEEANEVVEKFETMEREAAVARVAAREEAEAEEAGGLEGGEDDPAFREMMAEQAAEQYERQLKEEGEQRDFMESEFLLGSDTLGRLKGIVDYTQADLGNKLKNLKVMMNENSRQVREKEEKIEALQRLDQEDPSPDASGMTNAALVAREREELAVYNQQAQLDIGELQKEADDAQASLRQAVKDYEAEKKKEDAGRRERDVYKGEEGPKFAAASVTETASATPITGQEILRAF